VKPRDTAPAGDATAPMWCAQVELGTGKIFSPTGAASAPRCRLLVRLHGQVLGYLTLDYVPCHADPRIFAAAWTRWRPAIQRHLRRDELDVADGAAIPERTPTCISALTDISTAETVTAIVCTRDRPDDIAKCLIGLRRLSYPHLKILIVDNAPTDTRTRDVVAAAARHDSRISYVVEPQPGLSRARNRGLSAATGVYVAFTDDDVLVDDEWIQGVIRGFRSGLDVGCVTGLVCTAQINNRYERFFDARTASWSTRLAPVAYPPSLPRGTDPLYPYSAGRFGTGANFAFRRGLIDQLGGFDEILGAGTPCRGGEDLDAFVRIIRSGHSIKYEPSAVVWHRHRADLPALRKQMYAYGVGLTAYLAKLCRHRSTRRDIVVRIPAAAAHLVSLHDRHRGEAPHPAPAGARAAEFAGYLSGPFHFVISAVRARRATHRQAPQL
jgi:GT2 family glycosyltransferase